MPAAPGKKRKFVDRSAPKSRGWVFWTIIVVVILLAVVGLVWLLSLIPGQLTVENRRFRLENVDLEASGYWNGHSEEFQRILNIDSRKRSNLFALDLLDLRKRALSISDIYNASFQLVLPDTLRIVLAERVPMAQCKFRGNKIFLLDARGHRFPNRSGKVLALPLIVMSGDAYDCKPALKFLSGIMEYFIHRISVRRIELYPDHLSVFLDYSPGDNVTLSCKALFPNNVDADYVLLTSAFCSAVISHGYQEQGRYYDMRTPGKVFMR